MGNVKKLGSRELKVARPARAKLTEKEIEQRMRNFSKRKKEFVASVRANTRKLEAEVMKLDLSTRAALAQKLLASLDDLSEAERDELWAEEAERRLDELDSGKVKALDGETVLREIEDELA